MRDQGVSRTLLPPRLLEKDVFQASPLTSGSFLAILWHFLAYRHKTLILASCSHSVSLCVCLHAQISHIKILDIELGANSTLVQPHLN